MDVKPLTLPALTGVRFVAALWVVAYHVARPWLSAHEASPLSVSLADRGRDLLAGAPFAVTLFFVLSGFVLTWVYAPHVAGGMNTRAFAAARLSRVVPIYVLAVAAAVPIGVVARARGMVEDGYLSLLWVASATQAWIPDAALSWNPPLWSVSVEVAFYFSFLWLLPRLVRAAPRTLVGLAVAAWALSLGGGILYAALDPDGIARGVGHVRVESRGFWLHVLRFNPLARFPDLLTGMVAARLFLDGARLPRSAGTLGAFAIALVLASGVVPVPLLHGSLLAPLAAVLVVSLAQGDGPVARLLATTTMQRLGETSYALYALHIPVWLWMAALSGRKLEDFSALFSLAVVLASIAAAACAHIALERPLRERLRAMVAKGPPRPTSA